MDAMAATIPMCIYVYIGNDNLWLYYYGKSPNYSSQVWHMSRLPPMLTFGLIYYLQLFQLV